MKPKLFVSILVVWLVLAWIVPQKCDMVAQNDVSRMFQSGRIGDLNVHQPPAIAPGVVLVGLKPGVTLSFERSGAKTNDSTLGAVLRDIRVQSVQPVFPALASTVSPPEGPMSLHQVYRLHVPLDTDITRVAELLEANPAVAYAEPDYLAHLSTIPNDPLFSSQWGLAQIDAPAAWDDTTGTSDVVIAVVDAGIDASHSDLAGQLWANPGEIAGNSVDDDNNGYVDDVHGWNMVDNDANLSDNTGHGTQVAGVIASATNNGVGVAGVCWNCRLMIVKVVQPGGVANYSAIAAGVAYAAQKGAEVINLSLGGYTDSATLRAAIEAASQTAVIASGAGNDDTSARFYPAAYDDHVLAVAGTTPADTKIDTSNFGPWVDLSAPAEAIMTTFDGDMYGSTSGTSMAAPFVSGVAGLLRSQYPGWSAGAVRAHILHTADDLDALNPTYAGQLGSGRLNAGQAVTTPAQPLLIYESYSVDGEPNGRPEPGATVDLEVTLHNDWADATNVQAVLGTTDPHVSIATDTTTYGGITAYESATNVTPLRFSVDGAAPYGHSMNFTLAIIADGGYLLSIPLTISTSPGTTYVHGMLTSQTWTNDRTYIVDNETGIAGGHVLTIEAGTVVRFDGDYSLSVAGTLIADGTEQQPIRFTSNRSYPAAGEWGRIRFLDSCQDATFDGDGNYEGGSIVRYTTIEYGRGIHLENAAPYVAHNTLEYISGWGLSGSGTAGIAITDNTLARTGIHLSIPGGGFCVARNRVSGAPLEVWGPGLLAQNSVRDASGTGITASGVSTITANRVVGCNDGLFADGGYVSGNLLVKNNGYGLWISGGVPIVVSNTVALNGSAGAYVASGTPVLHGNNLIAAVGQYALRTATAGGIDATDNWWGTSDTASIQTAIYDGHDEFGVGVVDYNGYLSAPSPQAPAYVHGVTMLPDTTLGLEMATFDLQFSRSMDEGPSLAFGTTRRGTWQRFDKSNSGLTEAGGRAMVIDKNGDRWFGMVGDGVVVWRTDGTWQTVLPVGAVYGLTLDTDGDAVWVATNGLGTYVLSLTGTVLEQYSTPHQVMDVFIDSQGNKWIASWGQGLYKLRTDGTWGHYTSSNSGLASDLTYTVSEDKNGNVWCGFGDYGNIGVSALKPNGTWETYTEWNSDLAGNYVRTVAVDEAGDVWFGTSGGLSVLRTDGTWSNYAIGDGNSIAFIDGAVWVGEHYGGYGVAILRDGSIERIPAVDPGVVGLPDNTVHDIVQDSDGSIWFTTCCGSNPLAGVAVLWNGPTFEIQEGTWVGDTVWRAIYDVSALTPRDTYTLTVSGAVGADGIEVAADSRYTFTVDYAGQVTDRTPPPAPSVNARGRESDASYMEASWLTSDPESSITGYRYAIGSLKGASDVVNWTATTKTSLTRSGLGLTNGHVYWLSVQARNTSGLWSDIGFSLFFAGEPPHKVVLPLILRGY